MQLLMSCCHSFWIVSPVLQCFDGFRPSELMRAVPIALRHACLPVPIMLQFSPRAWNTWGETLNNAERMTGEKKRAKTESLWYILCMREQELGREKEESGPMKEKEAAKGPLRLPVRACACVLMWDETEGRTEKEVAGKGSVTFIKAPTLCSSH